MAAARGRQPFLRKWGWACTRLLLPWIRRPFLILRGRAWATGREMMTGGVLFPELCFEPLSSPSWRIEGERTTLEMLKDTAEFISYYRTLPQPTIAKVKETDLHLRLACNYVLISNVGEDVGSKTMGDTEDVLFRFVETGKSSKSNLRTEQETINTLRALKELDVIQEDKIGSDSPAHPLLSPRELRQVHHKLLQHDESREPGTFRSVLVYADVPGPLKDPKGTLKLHSIELCLRGIAASKGLPEVRGTMDQVKGALAHRLDCKEDEQVILLLAAQEIGYDGKDDINEIAAYLLPECISALFGLKRVCSIVSQSDKVDVEKALSQLSEYYGIRTAGPLTSEVADEIHQKLVAELPPTFYIYPLKTPEMIEETLQQLYEKQKRWFEVFTAKYADDDLRECQTLQEALWLLARIAAYSLFHFVCLHPFCDGNGRMCRLIASAIMSAIVPFPTGLACEQMPGAKTHSMYVDAIVDCRQRDEQKPVELATMIVEGAYYCSRTMKEALRDHLKLGEMTCAAQREEVASAYQTLDHSRRPGGHRADAEIEAVVSKMKEAIGLEQERIEVEFEDKYFVQVDILH